MAIICNSIYLFRDLKSLSNENRLYSTFSAESHNYVNIQLECSTLYSSLCELEFLELSYPRGKHRIPFALRAEHDVMKQLGQKDRWYQALICIHIRPIMLISRRNGHQQDEKKTSETSIIRLASCQGTI